MFSVFFLYTMYRNPVHYNKYREKEYLTTNVRGDIINKKR